MEIPSIVIVIFIVAGFLFLASHRSWGGWAKKGWVDLYSSDYDEEPSDLEIRAYYRRMAMEHVPSISSRAILKFPDEILDEMIVQERFDEASLYRIRHLKMARDRRDRDAFITYSIYHRIIATMQAEVAERDRMSLRERYPRIRRTGSVETETERPVSVDPMRLVSSDGDFADEPEYYPGERGKPYRDDDGTMYGDPTEPVAGRGKVKSPQEFLEFGHKGPGWKRPPLSPEKKEKFDHTKSAEYEPEKFWHKERRFSYEGDSALESAATSEGPETQEKLEVNDEYEWGEKSGESVEIPVKEETKLEDVIPVPAQGSETEPDVVIPESPTVEETEEKKKDEYTDLIDI